MVAPPSDFFVIFKMTPNVTFKGLNDIRGLFWQFGLKIAKTSTTSQDNKNLEGI